MSTLCCLILFIACNASSMDTDKAEPLRCCGRLCNIFRCISSTDDSKQDQFQPKSNQVLPVMTVNDAVPIHQIPMPSPHCHSPKLALFPKVSSFLSQKSQKKPIPTTQKSAHDLFASIKMYHSQMMSSHSPDSVSPKAQLSEDMESLKTTIGLTIFSQQDTDFLMPQIESNAVFKLNQTHTVDNFEEAKELLIQNPARIDVIFIGPSFTESKIGWFDFINWKRTFHELGENPIRSYFAIFASHENEYVEYLVHSAESVLTPFAYVTLRNDTVF